MITRELVEGLYCSNCRVVHATVSGFYTCPTCGGILEVRYNEKIFAEAAKKDFEPFPSSRSGVWKFFDLLPVNKRECIVSLEEGDTPLVRAHGLGRHFYVKDETRNPTGSFKDRPNTVGISKALELGAKTVAIASSGNAAGSLSAYAAKAGIPCVVAVPEDTPNSKLSQILVFGAKVARVRGTYSDAFNLIRESCASFGWHNLSSVCTANPYQVEGDKTVAYEIYEQLGRVVPDWVAIPLGAGPLLVGIWKGFRELYAVGLTEKLPKLIGVQAEGCAPIVRAFKSGEKEVLPWGRPHTIAHSIADPLVGYSQDGTLTLNKILESRGLAESTDDAEMIEAIRLLARKVGIFAEPAAASSVAVMTKLKRLGVVADDETVVSVVTGTGLKSLEAITESTGEVGIIEPKPESLSEILS